LAPANDIPTLREENLQLKAQLNEVGEERDEWDSLAYEEQNKRIAADTEIERLKAEIARLAAKSEALERQFQERTGTSAQEAIIVPGKELRSYDDLEDWADEVLGEHVLIHNAALKDCRKNGHPNMLSRIADVLVVVRDYWVPAKLNGGREKRETVRNKLRALGLEDSPCFVDREEARRTAGYSVQYDGESRVLLDHLKYGNGYDNANQIRIYYFWDENRKRFVVGKMPSHLRNNLTT
jgi:hypothetical protein